MNRRKFFNRMTQGLAAAVLATHLHFGSLAPVPVKLESKWIKLTFKYIPTPTGGTMNMTTSTVTDDKTKEMLEHYAIVGRQRVEMYNDSHAEYIQVPNEVYLMEDFGGVG